MREKARFSLHCCGGKETLRSGMVGLFSHEATSSDRDGSRHTQLLAIISAPVGVFS